LVRSPAFYVKAGKNSLPVISSQPFCLFCRSRGLQRRWPEAPTLKKIRKKD
jgi:hypothetical protein